MKAYQDASLAPARRAKALLEEMTLAEKVGQLNQRLYGFRIYERKCVNGEDSIELSEEFRQEVEKYSGLGVLYGLYRADPWADKDYETGLTGVLSKKAYNQVQRYVLEHSRLGIPVMMSSECPHGHQALDGYLLPVNLLAGATFDPAMVRAAYRVSGRQLQNMGVDNVVTFDAHDPRVQNAVPLMSFDNLMPSYQVLKAMFRNFPDLSTERDDFMIVSPDEGALNRNMYYASVLGVELGMFYKRRDYSRVVDGRNPIVAHEYLGSDVAGKDVFVSDDIISSGESMLDIAYNLKERKAKRIFTYATYAIFTNGLESFDKAYREGVIDGVFGSNLTYRTEELKNRPWFYEVDVSKYIAYFISALNHDMSVSAMIDPHEKINALLERRRRERSLQQGTQLTF